jgi:ABC-type Zn2+ transport system substrate-binding protein/surface adhesin
MKVMIFSGNEPSETVKGVIAKLKEERHQVMERNPDYFDQYASVDQTVDMVMVPETHPKAKFIRERYATIKKDVEFIAEPKPKGPEGE